MRLWSLHPRLLDQKGLVACWREALLAKAVLAGKTRGYRHHPQLSRFREQPNPLAAVNAYLAGIHAEAESRGYRFDGRKTGRIRTTRKIPVTSGQMKYEMSRLLRKVKPRNLPWYGKIRKIIIPPAHPVFRILPGPVEIWEKR